MYFRPRKHLGIVRYDTVLKEEEIDIPYEIDEFAEEPRVLLENVLQRIGFPEIVEPDTFKCSVPPVLHRTVASANLIDRLVPPTVLPLHGFGKMTSLPMVYVLWI